MQLTIRERIARRPRGEEGIALPAVIGMMAVVAMLSAAIITTAQSDVPQARRDQDRKAALASAEAGVNAYMFKLQRDPEVWTRCTGLSGTPFVNQPWDGSGTDPRVWRNVPASASQYTVELLPKAGQTQCSTSNPVGTMIAAGQIRVRSTGRTRGVKRSLIAKMRKRSFLDYLYYTDYETLDPAWYTRTVGGAPTSPDVTGWASDNCRYYRDGRSSKVYNGYWYDSYNRPRSFSLRCSEIQFAPGDRILGPMHTNDEFYICGSPQLGRTVDDSIEASASPPGWRAACSGASPNFAGSWTPGAPLLTMPPANDQLRDVVQPSYLFTGRTDIILSPASISVNGVSMPYPSNGVIYVQNGSCGQSYKPYDAYNSPAGCADVYVRGTYSQPLTIASAKDIIIRDDIIKSNNALLGLIANDFIRVWHPVQNLRNNNSDCDNVSGQQIGSVRIDSSLMALNHSFMVDYYFCGGPLGTLTVTGAIIQKYRGPVGQGGSTIADGYIKDYNYDDNFRYRQPPYFLDPIQSSWRLMSLTEQVPGR
ncbi:MAG: hypothetical protein LT070_08255 [Solirubrobacteraceae bacterium]|nr:hypothetical protein [Solirubrobacteraceae bacterium]